MSDELGPQITNEAFIAARIGDHPSPRKKPSRSSLWPILVAVTIVTLVLLIAPARLSPTRYGAWAAAVQAFGTVMAFAAAAVAFGWQWSRERELLELSMEAEERSQATSVYGWLSTTPEDPEDTGPDLPSFRVRICNRSGLPIYKALLEVVDGRNPGEPVLIPTLLEWTHPLDMVPPMSMITARLPNYGGAMGWRPALQVSFTDAAGRHWIRHSSGPVVQLKHPAWMSKNTDMSWSWEGILVEGTVTPL